MKVIVVGGGPVGLVAAHALSRIGVDFIILESRPEVVIDAGSNLVLMPMGMRPLFQLGLEDSIVAATSALGAFKRIDHEGKGLGTMHLNEYLDKFIGASPRVISRHDLTKILYESLPADAQAKIIPNKRAATVTVEPESDLVTVTCRDGSSYTGNLIVGADGAHSLIREQMRLLALATAASSPDPGSKGVNEEKPYLSTYRCVWIRFPSSLYPDLEPGAARETHGYECATQLFQGEETGVVGLYEKLEKPTREWVRFTKEDEEAVIDRWGHLPMIKGSEMKLREIYDSRIESGLVSLEEGVLDHWSWDGRIVLAGDAAHKFTPSTGAGCNNGIIDVVVLANELEKALSGDSEPTKDELASVLHRYQSARYESVVDGCQQSGNATSMATWSSQVVKFIDTWVVPLRAFQKRAFRQGAELSALTPAFDFVPGEERIIGEVPWVKSIPLFVS